ncbi:hypothetical protein ACLOJK_034569 [Asimina triloba]
MERGVTWEMAVTFSSISSSLLRSSLHSCPAKTLPSLHSPFLSNARPKYFRVFSSSMASEPKESPSNNPGLAAEADDGTKGYFMQQTAVDFLSIIFKCTRLLKRLDFPEMKFSLYFVGYENLASAPTDPVQRTVWTFSQKATIELTHNWGTESDPDFKGYHNGNSEPRGFGHIGITVDDTYKACERFERLGVEFVKKPDDGKMKGLAFIKDPDGYWIEIFDLNRIGQMTTAAA